MIFVLDEDACLAVFPSPKEVEAHLELVEIEHHLCTICDQYGQRYAGVIVNPGDLFKPDRIQLRPENCVDRKLPKTLIQRAQDFSSFCPEIRHIQDLHQYLKTLPL